MSDAWTLAFVVLAVLCVIRLVVLLRGPSKPRGMSTSDVLTLADALAAAERGEIPAPIIGPLDPDGDVRVTMRAQCNCVAAQPVDLVLIPGGEPYVFDCCGLSVRVPADFRVDRDCALLRVDVAGKGEE